MIRTPRTYLVFRYQGKHTVDLYSKASGGNEMVPFRNISRGHPSILRLMTC